MFYCTCFSTVLICTPLSEVLPKKRIIKESYEHNLLWTYTQTQYILWQQLGEFLIIFRSQRVYMADICGGHVQYYAVTSTFSNST